jgi:hypothetical protein
MSMSAEDLLAQAQRVVAKAWADDAFKAALIADPRATLAQEGIALPAGLTLKVLENTADTLHVILPPPPSAALSDEAVGAVVGAGVYNVCFGSSVIPTSQNFTIASLYCAGVPTDLPNLAPGSCQTP